MSEAHAILVAILVISRHPNMTRRKRTAVLVQASHWCDCGKCLLWVKGADDKSYWVKTEGRFDSDLCPEKNSIIQLDPAGMDPTGNPVWKFVKVYAN